MSTKDPTQAILEQMLASLYQQQSGLTAPARSYLIAQDDQFLGNINSNRLDRDSITNQYGPYGSPYSATCIFNSYSQYGSRYGQFSLNNPYTSTPPRLFLQGKYVGVVTANRFLPDRIDNSDFLYAIKHDIDALANGSIRSATDVVPRPPYRRAFLQGADGVFLGSLVPNEFDPSSIFNDYGSFGSTFSQTSIFNNLSPYGSDFSPKSAFNPVATSPPSIKVGTHRIAFLTANESIGPRVDPSTIRQWSAANVVAA